METQNEFEKYNTVIEPHLLDLHFSHVRLHSNNALSQLMTSIEHHGQLVAVTVVPTEQQRFVLIDGYMRLKAIQRIGQDTIKAEVWKTQASQASLSLFASQQSTKLEVIEEAMLLREIKTRFSLTQAKIADKIGRSASWISYRLNLINDLSDDILNAIYEGKLSTWAASRIFVPFARANAQHAEQFLKYLIKNYHSTREQQQFFEHYQTSNHQVRNKMIADPALFFTSQKVIAQDKQAKQLAAGPAGKWLSKVIEITKILEELKQLAPIVFYPRQPSVEKKSLIDAFDELQIHSDKLSCNIRKTTDVRSTI